MALDRFDSWESVDFMHCGGKMWQFGISQQYTLFYVSPPFSSGIYSRIAHACGHVEQNLISGYA